MRKYTIPKGTRIERHLRDGRAGWSWSKFVTTKDAYYTDGDIEHRQFHKNTIRFRIPDPKYDSIVVDKSRIKI